MLREYIYTVLMSKVPLACQALSIPNGQVIMINFVSYFLEFLSEAVQFVEFIYYRTASETAVTGSQRHTRTLGPALGISKVRCCGEIASIVIRQL